MSDREVLCKERDELVSRIAGLTDEVLKVQCMDEYNDLCERIAKLDSMVDEYNVTRARQITSEIEELKLAYIKLAVQRHVDRVYADYKQISLMDWFKSIGLDEKFFTTNRLRPIDKLDIKYIKQVCEVAKCVVSIRTPSKVVMDIRPTISQTTEQPVEDSKTTDPCTHVIYVKWVTPGIERQIYTDLSEMCSIDIAGMVGHDEPIGSAVGRLFTDQHRKKYLSAVLGAIRIANIFDFTDPWVVIKTQELYAKL